MVGRLVGNLLVYYLNLGVVWMSLCGEILIFWFCFIREEGICVRGGINWCGFFGWYVVFGEVNCKFVCGFVWERLIDVREEVEEGDGFLLLLVFGGLISMVGVVDWYVNVELYRRS